MKLIEYSPTIAAIIIGITAAAPAPAADDGKFIKFLKVTSPNSVQVEMEGKLINMRLCGIKSTKRGTLQRWLTTGGKLVAWRDPKGWSIYRQGDKDQSINLLLLQTGEAQADGNKDCSWES
jgi:hypothetical protein